jgi:tellurite resistance protein TerC
MIWIWLGFLTLIAALLALDLGVFNRKNHVFSIKEALGWSAVWIIVACLFGVFVYHAYDNHWLGIGKTPDGLVKIDPVDKAPMTGYNATVKYFTGYVIEKSLSADNIFVIAMIFAYFGVPSLYQHRVLFWGILGAIVLRGVMIAIGAVLIARFNWILYVFGAFLLLTAVKMLFMNTEEQDPSKNFVVRALRRFFPITQCYHGAHFIVRAGSKASHEARCPGEEEQTDPIVQNAQPGKILLTPLALALAIVESTDVVFAVDSIPAIYAITGDPFIVFTSNIFAIMGLRSLYFALAGMIRKFRFLKASLAAVLAIVGVKMLAHTWLKSLLGQHFSLYLFAMILLVLILGVVASILFPAPDEKPDPKPV